MTIAIDKVKMDQFRPHFVYFNPIANIILVSAEQIKSVDFVLGIWTPGHRMIGAKRSTNLWQTLVTWVPGFDPYWLFIKGKKNCYEIDLTDFNSFDASCHGNVKQKMFKNFFAI